MKWRYFNQMLPSNSHHPQIVAAQLEALSETAPPLNSVHNTLQVVADGSHKAIGLLPVLLLFSVAAHYPQTVAASKWTAKTKKF